MIQELYTLISNKIIDNGLSHAVYANTIPNGAIFPCIRMTKISEEYYQTKEPSLYGRARWQIDVYANSNNTTSAIETVKTIGAYLLELNGYLGTGEIIEIRVDDTQYDYEEAIEAHIYRIDYLIQHN